MEAYNMSEHPDEAMLLRRIKEHYPQVDNGTCAVCRIGYREYINGNPGPCLNGSCLSHAIDAGINAPTQDSGAQWQSLSTAPKDGTAIIIGRIEKGKVWHVRMGVWAKIGWYEVNSGAGINFPTHWMPLPALPDAEGEHL